MNADAQIEWRELERSGLVDEIRAALRGGRSVMVTGDAGVGKSTVLRQSAPEESVWLQGLEGLASVALAPFSLVAVEPPLESVATAYRWIGTQAEAGMTLVVDDAQWIDPVSSGLLAQAINSDQIRVVMSVRSGHSISEDLARAATKFDRLAVDPLDTSMVELALELALDAEPLPDLVQVFARQSGGNPLYLRELVLGAIHDGSMQRTGQTWQLKNPPRISSALAGLVHTRLARLSPAGRRAAEYVALADSLPVDIVVAAAGADAVAEAITTGFLVERDGDVYPGHPTYADAIRDFNSRAHRRSLLRDLTTATSRQPPGSFARARAVEWQLELGQVPALDDLEAAYSAAVRAGNLERSGRIATAAYHHYPSVATGLRAANQLHRDNRHGEAAELVESLKPMAEASGKPDDIARIASHLMRVQGVLGLFLESAPAAGALDSETLKWADRHLEDAPFEALEQALGDTLAGDPASMRDLERLLGHSVEIVRADAMERLMYIGLASGDDIVSYTLGAELARIDDPYVSDRPATASPLWAVAVGSRSADRMAEAYEIIRAQYERIENVSAPLAVGIAHSYAVLCIVTGRIRDAKEAIRFVRSVAGIPAWLSSYAMMAHGMLLCDSGQQTEGLAALSQADEQAASATDIVSAMSSISAVTRVHLLFYRAIAGDTDALKEMRADADRPLTRWYSLVLRSRLGDVDEQMINALEAYDNPYADAHATLCRARLAGDPNQIANAAELLAAIGTLPDAIEALANAIDLHQQRGEQREASRLTARHQDLMARCPGLRLPTTMITIDAPDLTKRERQVCELGALGWSNRQIADELSISVRTVENNLQRAYTKLGINRRADLGAALGLQPA